MPRRAVGSFDQVTIGVCGSHANISILEKHPAIFTFDAFGRTFSYSMAFEIQIVRHFSAAHQLRLYNGSLEPLHGHNWVVRVTVARAELDRIGVVMDFHKLERIVDKIIGPMDNRHLNELPAFDDLNPSAENVALHVARNLALPASVKLLTVQVWETPENSAIYRP